MEGNVFEWVGDWYDALYYKNGAAQDPLGPDAGQQRSVRSSSYKSKPEQIPASTRVLMFRRTTAATWASAASWRTPVISPPPANPSACGRPGLRAVRTAAHLQTDCPKVGIGLTAVCQKGKVTVVVGDNHSPDLNAVVTGLGACTPVVVAPNVFPQVYDCTSDTTVRHHSRSATMWPRLPQLARRTTRSTPPPACANGTAPARSADNACPARPTIRPISAAARSPAAPAIIRSARWAPRWALCSGKPVCVPNDQALNKPSQTELVHVQDPATCTGGSIGGCTLTDASCKQSCRYGGVLIPSACACACNPG